MGLETGTYISDLVSTNPLGSDAKSTADDHLRLIKAVIKQSLTGFSGAIIVSGTDSGVTNSYVLSPTPALAGYGTNMVVVLKPANSNTGAATINISGLGAKSILGAGGSPLIASELTAGIESLLIYNGTAFQLANVSKSYIDNLAFAGALPSSPLDGAVVQNLNGVSQWAYVTQTLPLGAQIAANELVAADINGNSIAVSTLTPTVAVATGYSSTSIVQLTSGNLVHCYLGGSNYPTFAILNEAGTIQYGPTTIVSASGTRPIVEALSTGGFVVAWVSGGSIRYAIYSNTGTVVLAATAVTSAAANEPRITELSNGNICIATRNGSAYPTFIIYSQAGASVVAETVIESTATNGVTGSVYGISGSFVAMYSTSGGSLRIAKYTNAGASSISPTVLGTGVNGNICQLINGNLAYVFRHYTTFYPTFGIIDTSFVQVYSNTTIESSICGNEIFNPTVTKFDNGSCAILYTISGIAKISVRTDQGDESYPPTSWSSNTQTSICLSSTRVANANGCFVSYYDSYPKFIGAFNNNSIAGISTGYSTTKQLIKNYGVYDAGTAIKNTLGKITYYQKIGGKFIF